MQHLLAFCAFAEPSKENTLIYTLHSGLFDTAGMKTMDKVMWRQYPVCNHIKRKLNDLKLDSELMLNHMTHYILSIVSKHSQVSHLIGRELDIAVQLTKVIQDQIEAISAELDSFLDQCSQPSARQLSQLTAKTNDEAPVLASKASLTEDPQRKGTGPESETTSLPLGSCLHCGLRSLRAEHEQDSRGLEMFIKLQAADLKQMHAENIQLTAEVKQYKDMYESCQVDYESIAETSNANYEELQQLREETHARLRGTLGEQNIEALCTELRNVHHLASDALKDTDLCCTVPLKLQTESQIDGDEAESTEAKDAFAVPDLIRCSLSQDVTGWPDCLCRHDLYIVFKGEMLVVSVVPGTVARVTLPSSLYA